LVGYCAIVSIAPEAEILRIGVISECRCKSIGTNLLDRMVCDLESEGISKLFLEVRADNQSACAFYRKNGFMQIGERKQYYKTPSCDALIFQRRIKK